MITFIHKNRNQYNQRKLNLLEVLEPYMKDNKNKNIKKEDKK